MKIRVQTIAENVQRKGNDEYVSIVCIEVGVSPLQQMLEFALRDDDLKHKGQLVGKELELQITSIRDVFCGRPQTAGRILDVATGAKK